MDFFASPLPDPVASDVRTREPLYPLPLHRLAEGSHPHSRGRRYDVVEHAIVTGPDFVHFSRWRWTLTQSPQHRFPYGCRYECKGGKSVMLYLHREIYARHNGDIPKGFTVDHADRCSVHNNPANLRHATPSQQMTNQLRKSSATARFRGVRMQPNFRWQTYISYRKKSVSLGTYPTDVQAGIAYNVASALIEGSFGVPNAIPPSEMPGPEVISEIESRVRARLNARHPLPSG